MNILKMSNSELYYHLHDVDITQESLDLKKIKILEILHQYKNEDDAIELKSFNDIVYVILELFVLKDLPFVGLPHIMGQLCSPITTEMMTPKRNLINKEELLISLLREL